MIKIVGAIILVGAASALGYFASSVFSVRERVLMGFGRSLDIMHSEIGEYLTPIEELMEKLCALSIAPLDMFFGACLREMREKPEVPFRLIWVKNIKRADYLRLRPNETEVIAALGSVLGRYGAAEQKKAIEHTHRSIESMTAIASRDKKRLGGLYARLGVISGIAIVIVFI